MGGNECERPPPVAECTASIKRTGFARVVLQVFVAEPELDLLNNRPRESHR